METSGGSSLSMIVPVAFPTATVALTGAESATENLSSGSSTASSVRDTDTVRVLPPGANVSVPDAASKSWPAIAVPSFVA